VRRARGKRKHLLAQCFEEAAFESSLGDSVREQRAGRSNATDLVEDESSLQGLALPLFVVLRQR
jgi:hypothetical protein